MRDTRDPEQIGLKIKELLKQNKKLKPHEAADIIDSTVTLRLSSLDGRDGN